MAIQGSKATGSKINIDQPGIILKSERKLVLARFCDCKTTFQGKISAQPHITFCIQFLDRENNNENNTVRLAKQICFTIVRDYAEILPVSAVISVVFHCSASVVKPRSAEL